MRTCEDCPKTLGPRNQTGLCIACLNKRRSKDPEFRAKLVEGMKRRLAHDPVLAESYRARARSLKDLPQTKEAKRKRWMAEKPWTKSNICRPAGSEARVRAARTQSATLLADIPAHLREAYRTLTRSKAYKAAEARAVIMQQHETELARWRRQIGAPDDALPPPPINPDAEIIDQVAALTGVSREDIESDRRLPKFVDARALIAVSLREDGLTFREIGDILKADHSSAVHLIKTFDQRLAKKPALAAIYDRLTEALAA